MAFFEVKSSTGSVMFAAEPSKRAMVYRGQDTAYPSSLYLVGDNVDNVASNSSIPKIHNCTATYQAESAEDVPVFFHPLPIGQNAENKGIVQTSLRFNPSTLVWTAYFLARDTGSFPVYIYSRIRDDDVPNKASPGQGVHLFDAGNKTVFTTNKRPLNLLTSYPVSIPWSNNTISSPPSPEPTIPTYDSMAGTDAPYSVAGEVEDFQKAGWTRDVYCTLTENISEDLAGSPLQFVAYDLNTGRQRRWTCLVYAVTVGFGGTSISLKFRFILTLNALSSGSLIGYNGSGEISGNILRARHPEDIFPNTTYSGAGYQVPISAT